VQWAPVAIAVATFSTDTVFVNIVAGYQARSRDGMSHAGSCLLLRRFQCLLTEIGLQFWGRPTCSMNTLTWIFAARTCLRTLIIFLSAILNVAQLFPLQLVSVMCHVSFMRGLGFPSLIFPTLFLSRLRSSLRWLPTTWLSSPSLTSQWGMDAQELVLPALPDSFPSSKIDVISKTVGPKMFGIFLVNKSDTYISKTTTIVIVDGVYR